jgi:hypothetical protein
MRYELIGLLVLEQLEKRGRRSLAPGCSIIRRRNA